MFFPPVISYAGVVLGLCALVFGARRLATLLAAPGIWRWIVWPLAVRLIRSAPLWADVLAIIVTVVALPFLAVKTLQRVVEFGYGERAGGHVGGVYLVRLFDGFAFLVSLPLRALTRRRRAEPHAGGSTL